MQPMLSNMKLEGDWQVVLEHPKDDSNWYIYNTKTGKYKKVGPIGAHRTNYYHKAFEVAEKLNKE
jgi:hypothetical protein